jgi:chromosomal replication initiation ATPase DnaA
LNPESRHTLHLGGFNCSPSIRIYSFALTRLVAFTTAAALAHELMEARDERRLRALQKHLNIVKLLIIDELGYVPFTAVGSELLFEVFSQRYERGSTLVTGSRARAASNFAEAPPSARSRRGVIEAANSAEAASDSQ